MLIQFRVENHRSLRDEHVLSLVAASDKAGARVLRPEGLGEALVPVVAIYGANASGKSNVLGALEFMRRAVLDSQRRWDVDGTPHEPFLLSEKANEPSLYELDFMVSGVRYRYGFRLGAVRVEEEWLFTWPHGRRAMWLEREGDRFEFGKTLQGENEAIRNLTRPNSLFLSAAAQNNHGLLLPIFRHLTAWQGRRRHVSSGLSIASTRLIERGTPEDRGQIIQLIREADTGIVDIRVDLAEPQLPLDLGSETLTSSRLVEGTLESTTVFPPVRGFANTFRSSEISFGHRSATGEPAWLPLSLQSAGTVALLDLAPHILAAFRDGSLLCIDELESSLHPTLALYIVRMFNDPAQNTKGAQLVFATHDTNLLGSVLGEPALARDQVWFTEKDETGATHLYPLTDFHPRKEENLERGYLQGRYGAIPFLGDLVDRSGESELQADGDEDA